MRRLLKGTFINFNFFLLWQGQIVSQIGNQAFIIASIFWLKEEVNSATLVGLLMGIMGIAPVIFGAWGGTLADRYPRKLIMVLTDALSGLLLFLLIALLSCLPSLSLKIASLFIIAFLLEALATFYRPSVMAMIPDIVPNSELFKANALTEGSAQLARAIGQALGGVLYSIMGALKLILFDAITFLFSALSEAFIKAPESHLRREERPPLLEELRAGIRYVLKEKGIRDLLLGSGGLNFFAFPIITLFPFYIGDFLRLGAQWYGFAMGAFSLGNLLGFYFAGALRLKGYQRFSVNLALILSILSLIPLLVIPRIDAVILSTFFNGLFVGYFNVKTITMIQLRVPKDFLGRVFGILDTIIIGLSPLSMFLSGLAYDLTKGAVLQIYALAIGAMAIISLWLLLSRSFQEDLAILDQGI